MAVLAVVCDTIRKTIRKHFILPCIRPNLRLKMNKTPSCKYFSASYRHIDKLEFPTILRSTHRTTKLNFFGWFIIFTLANNLLGLLSGFSEKSTWHESCNAQPRISKELFNDGREDKEGQQNIHVNGSKVQRTQKRKKFFKIPKKSVCEFMTSRVSF